MFIHFFLVFEASATPAAIQVYSYLPLFAVFVELKEAKRRKKRMAEQLKHEEALAAALKVWNTEILKDWETMYVIFITSLRCIYTERK